MTAQLSPARVGRITASRVPIILGLSPYQSHDGLLREMVREALGAPSEWTDDDLKRWGTDHEEDARTAYEAKTGRLVLDAQDFVQHPDIEWGGCSPDGLIGHDGVWEGKCPPPRRGLWTSLTQKPAYEAQIQWLLACTGRAWCDGTIWRPEDEAERIGCEPVIIERYYADPDWLPTNLGKLADFHREFLEIVADPAKAAPFLESPERDDPEWARAAAEFLAADDAVAAAGRRLDQAKAALRDLAGDRSAKGCGVSVTRTERAGSVDWRSIAEKYAPDVDPESFRKASAAVWTIRATA